LVAKVLGVSIRATSAYKLLVDDMVTRERLISTASTIALTTTVQLIPPMRYSASI